ncbi:MAG TPA: type III-A CRISPR-associated protein Csm2 [Acetivibrio sp.]|nr:type III-A CRISPR-associated protein Csm2 [Acetivibrio sp.]
MDVVSEIGGLLEDNTFSCIEPEKLVEVAKKIGEQLKEKDLKNTQLRKFYDAVKAIEIELRGKKPDDEIGSDPDIMAKLIFLKPVIHYTAIRIEGLKDLENIMNIAFSKIKTKKDFTYFVKFFEAIVAYHSSDKGGINDGQ